MEKELQETSEVNVQFFIDELARITTDNDRRYLSLSRRVAELEEEKRPGLLMEENPMGALIGIMALMMITEAILPLVMEGIRRWRSPSLPSSE